ncbi:hypothetical protein [Pleionea sediminis]|uniref:hypothetical protein n=1 Tax=Pleionea sediminis TaxID=2569479 RepID=UPI0011868EF7|nr:hypothetical protein [Pleionea sediminis]
MRAKIKTKSGQSYDVGVAKLFSSKAEEEKNYPSKGELIIDQHLREKFKEEARHYGAWDEVMNVDMSVEMNGETHDIEILFKDMPISESVDFETIGKK